MPTKLEQLQLQFRQRLMQEKEERMIKIHTDSQQKALNKVLRYDSNGPATSQNHQTVLSASATNTSTTSVRKPASMTSVGAHPQAHNTSPAKKSSPGVDRSRPLPPINRNGHANNRNNNNNNNFSFAGDSTSSSTSTSSSSSSSSTKVTPVHNGVRSRSVDTDAANRFMFKPSVKVKHGTDTNHHVTDGNRYTQQGTQATAIGTNYSDRKSPEIVRPKQQEILRPKQQEIVRPKQQEILRPKAKPSYETPATKLSNGHTTTSFKSSVEQRTMAGNIKMAVHTGNTNSTPAPRKTKAMAQYVPMRKSLNGSNTTAQSKSKNLVSRGVPKIPPTIPRKPPNPNQEQCTYCGRNFNKDRIDKHTDICGKTSRKKVKVFDVTKMRVKGTEAESFVRKGITVNPPKAKKTDWKKQHEDFINTIRQAKLAQRHLAAGGKLSDLPPPPPSDTSSYVPCPYCGRKFDDGVAQRHIPKCKNILSNKKTPTTTPFKMK